MELSEKAEEVLETLWIKTLEEGLAGVPKEELEAVIGQVAGTSVSEGTRPSSDGSWAGEQVLKDLESADYITPCQAGYELTEIGQPFAENVVRRHRLAERLLADVLDAWNETNHAKACKFEHLLDRGLDDRICTLLGHPKVCPHGKPIPPGKCCKQMSVSSTRLVSPLSQLAEGQTGKVAYIFAQKLDQLQKLTAMGILPGASISVSQTFPAYLFQIGQTQFAVDREIADAIYVRLSQETDKVAVNTRPAKQRTRIRWRIHSR